MDKTIISKRSPKEAKTANQLLILETLIKENSLSRIELSEKTGLSASTVTSLTADLLNRGAIMESGERVFTAGRTRVGLTVNDGLGLLIVTEISHRGVYLTALDMHLNVVASRNLSSIFADGNQVLREIVEKVNELCDTLPLAGLGLLFQEDVSASDFNVMYSTGYEAATISLRDALKTQYRVPVLEETGQAFTVSDIIADVGLDKHMVAHIQLGATIRTMISVDGKTIPLREHFAEDVTRSFDLSVPAVREAEPAPPRLLVTLLNMIYAIFPLDAVLISSPVSLPDSFVETLKNQIDHRIVPGTPDIRLLMSVSRNKVATAFATRVRTRILRCCIGISA